MVPERLPAALDRLERHLRGLGGLVVAFSGGVDSTVLLVAAARWLPACRVVAATADSPSLARAELAEARRLAVGFGIEHAVLATGELDVAGYRANAGNRCYFCKRTMLTAMRTLAAQRGLPYVATGTHLDDRRSAHRPGLRAAAELSVVEPLADAGLGKTEVRAAAALWGLSVADKPAAPCLASRIAVGVPVSAERLYRVEQSEHTMRVRLARAGIIPRNLRVRLLEHSFRIELDDTAYAQVGRAGLAADLVGRLSGSGLEGPGTVERYQTGSVAAAPLSGTRGTGG